MSIETTYLSLEWTYIFLTLCLVLNRLYVRALHRSRSSALTATSDALVVIAWIFVLLSAAFDCVTYSKGWLAHVGDFDVDANSIVIFIKILYLEDLFYYVPLYCIKAAILCFLLEITPPVLVHIRRAIWVGVGFVIIGFLFNMGAFLVYCPGGSDYWHPFESINCDIAGNAAVAAIGLHMFTDLYIYVIPFFLIRKLSLLSWLQKFSALFMFSSGFLLVGIAFLQIGFLTDTASSFSNMSFMFGLFCCIHEQNLAMAVACLPALRATIRQIYKLFTDGDTHGVKAKRRSRRSMLIDGIRRGERSTREVFSQGGTEVKCDVLEGDEKGDAVTSKVESSHGSAINVYQHGSDRDSNV